MTNLFLDSTLLWSPWLFALLVASATFMLWQALAPARPARQVGQRLDGYLERSVTLDDQELTGSLFSRAGVPLLRRLLRTVGAFMPQRHFAQTQELLVQAGEPGNFSALDFLGLRLLLALLLGGGYLFWLSALAPVSDLLRNTLIAAAAGYLLPQFWLRRRVRSRKQEILIALPDALDMMTIGVEAGLAFESAMLRVGEQWQNALSAELRRAVNEMRMGVTRNEALQRLAARVHVDELQTFIGVLVQSNQLGVSIAQVLHSQADQMRLKRRQRAEELARQASVKIVVVLVFFILPVLFIVILGPSIPRILDMLDSMARG
ncbi:MAG: type II secretion system F family protein [Caldilineaceae bacterium]